MTILSAPALYVDRRRAGYFILASDMRYVWYEKDCALVIVPEGTETNFASIPRAFRFLFPVNGKHRLAAVLHDYLYANLGEISTNGHKLAAHTDASPKTLTYTRKDADKEFYRAMRLEGTNRFVASALYRAVRLFGGAYIKLTAGNGWKT